MKAIQEKRKNERETETERKNWVAERKEIGVSNCFCSPSCCAWYRRPYDVALPCQPVITKSTQRHVLSFSLFTSLPCLRFKDREALDNSNPLLWQWTILLLVVEFETPHDLQPNLQNSYNQLSAGTQRWVVMMIIFQLLLFPVIATGVLHSI